MKDKYRKIIQKPPPKSGSGAVVTKNKWRFFELMQFTRDTRIPGKMIGSLSMPVATPFNEENCEIVENCLNMEEEDEPNLPPQVETGPSSSRKTTNTTANSNFASARPHRSKSAIASKHELEREMVELEKQKLSAILSIQENAKKKEEEGDDYHFFMSLLPYMKNLDPLLKLELRGKIQTEVMHSYRINQQQTVPTLQVFNQHQTQPRNYNSHCQPSNNLVSPSLSDDHLQSGYSSSSSSQYQHSGSNSNGPIQNQQRAPQFLDLHQDTTTLMRGYDTYCPSNSLVSPASLNHPPSRSSNSSGQF